MFRHVCILFSFFLLKSSFCNCFNGLNSMKTARKLVDDKKTIQQCQRSPRTPIAAVVIRRNSSQKVNRMCNEPLCGWKGLAGGPRSPLTQMNLSRRTAQSGHGHRLKPVELETRRCSSKNTARLELAGAVA